MIKVSKWTQELIQLDPHQVVDIKGKDRQIQLNSHKKNRWQAELATLSQKGGNSVTQTFNEHIFNLHDTLKKNISKWNTAEHLTKSTTMEVSPWKLQ